MDIEDFENKTAPRLAGKVGDPMKYYLSSSKIGNEEKKLLQMTESGNKKVAYIHNALDYTSDVLRREQSDEANIKDLQGLGFSVDILDLKLYCNYIIYYP
ncbi:hypothetical protein [Paenibacillus senegalensis]|uniref:hypothetical protein n=1 Tax=Paenibacillus senegalensis TaxID=1465766 RepID=UPI000289F8B7|nr:hypothetical protein [Paenibacillus senegalensis]